MVDSLYSNIMRIDYKTLSTRSGLYNVLFYVPAVHRSKAELSFMYDPQTDFKSLFRFRL